MFKAKKAVEWNKLFPRFRFVFLLGILLETYERLLYVKVMAHAEKLVVAGNWLH